MEQQQLKQQEQQRHFEEKTFHHKRWRAFFTAFDFELHGAAGAVGALNYAEFRALVMGGTNGTNDVAAALRQGLPEPVSMLLFNGWDDRANELAESEVGRRGERLRQEKAALRIQRAFHRKISLKADGSSGDTVHRRVIRSWMTAVVDTEFSAFWHNSLTPDQDREMAMMYEASRGCGINMQAFVDTVWSRGFICGVSEPAARSVAEAWARHVREEKPQSLE